MGAQNGTRAHELDPRKEMGAQDSRRGSTSTQGTPQQAAAGGQKPHGLEPQSMALRATDARVEPRKGGVVQRTAEAWEAEIVEEKAACREGVGRGCGQTCGKALQCGHRCGRACHPGEACQQPVLVRAADSCRSDLGGECAGSDGRDDLVRGESRGAVGAVDGQGGGEESLRGRLGPHGSKALLTISSCCPQQPRVPDKNRGHNVSVLLGVLVTLCSQ